MSIVPEWQVGERIHLKDLKNSTQFNGMPGTISVVQEDGKLVVRADNGAEIKVQARNVSKLSLSPGDQVSIQGLQNQTAYNGRLATVVSAVTTGASGGEDDKVTVRLLPIGGSDGATQPVQLRLPRSKLTLTAAGRDGGGGSGYTSPAVSATPLGSEPDDELRSALSSGEYSYKVKRRAIRTPNRQQPTTSKQQGGWTAAFTASPRRQLRRATARFHGRRSLCHSTDTIADCAMNPCAILCCCERVRDRAGVPTRARTRTHATTRRRPRNPTISARACARPLTLSPFTLPTSPSLPPSPSLSHIHTYTHLHTHTARARAGAQLPLVGAHVRRRPAPRRPRRRRRRRGAAGPPRQPHTPADPLAESSSVLDGDEKRERERERERKNER